MELKVQLMFLPESVRAMPLKTFIDDFGGSLENVIQNVKEQDYNDYIASQQDVSMTTSVETSSNTLSILSTGRSNESHDNSNSSTRLSSPKPTVASNTSVFEVYSILSTRIPVLYSFLCSCRLQGLLQQNCQK